MNITGEADQDLEFREFKNNVKGAFYLILTIPPQ